MPKKSIRETTRPKCQNDLLASRTFHATIIPDMVSFAIGSGLYAIALGGQYIGKQAHEQKNGNRI